MSDTLVLVRNSERARFKECRQAWHWGYRHTLEPDHQRGALAFGGMSHDALADWYIPGRERGTHPAETFSRLYAENADEFAQWDDEGNRIPALDLGVSMMNEYVDRYGDDPMIEIVQPEMPFQIDVYDKKGNYLATLVGRFDAIALNLKTGWYFVFEHKTGKSIEYVRINSKYGEQGLSYFWAATYWLEHVLGIDIKLDGVGYNWLRKAMPDERPCNADGLYLNKPSKDALVAACVDASLPTKGTVEVLTYRLSEAGLDPAQLGIPSKNQPPPYFARQMMRLSPNQLETFNRRLRQELFEMALVKQKKLGVYKAHGMHCQWCSFRDVCELHEMGQDWEDVLRLEFKKWEPYSDHALHLELVQ